MGNDFFWCCFYHFYANTNLCEKLVFENFSVIFPGCGLECKKGNSRFPFSEEQAIHIAYRLFKVHHQIINSGKYSVFLSMCYFPPLQMLFTLVFQRIGWNVTLTCCWYHYFQWKNSTSALKNNYSVQDLLPAILTPTADQPGKCLDSNKNTCTDTGSFWCIIYRAVSLSRLIISVFNMINVCF